MPPVDERVVACILGVRPAESPERRVALIRSPGSR